MQDDDIVSNPSSAMTDGARRDVPPTVADGDGAALTGLDGRLSRGDLSFSGSSATGANLGRSRTNILPPSDMAERQQRLSYKFQRLRERLREAIETGVLSGKLPGERVLARQFRVNAKTLSKALTDLAAEGLLERTIGRGTFVRGASTDGDGQVKKEAGRWLLLCRSGCECSALALALRGVHSDTEVLSDLATLRPSFLNGFTAVVDLHGELPELILRDLILRSLRVILVDSLPKTYSTHSVLIDRPFCAGMVARDLIQQGYRHLMVVRGNADEAEIYASVHTSARRMHAGGDVKVEIIDRDEVTTRAKAHVTDSAFLCTSMETAGELRYELAAAGVSVPDQAAIVGIGIDAPLSSHCQPASGYVVSADQVADCIRQLIDEVQMHRPTPLWLVGNWVERGSSRVAATMSSLA